MADIDAHLKKFQKELSAGTVSLVLLAVLGAAAEPMYGYQIAKRLERGGEGAAGRQAERACTRCCATSTAPACWPARSSRRSPVRRDATTASPPLGQEVLPTWTGQLGHHPRLRRYRAERNAAMTVQTPRNHSRIPRAAARALAGADPALVQDALYDAEEYLRSELAENPDVDEATLLAGIATSYGAPDEVADIYRDTENTVIRALRPPPKRDAPLAGRQVLRRRSPIRAPIPRCSTCCCRWRPASSTSPGR